MQPSISIVVTCHNYGHFLEACLASLGEQTRPPDEIIVIDDGSTDATPTILQGYSKKLKYFRQDNHGQASAFNSGFARTTGDLVLFLDADDTLMPDAIEILCASWHESLAAIAFGLNLINGTGCSTGSYPVEASEGDMRPELIGRGHFRFMPTSGNVFNRKLVAPGFPLPEARWRISADAVLLRVAALAGPVRRIPFALGSYRAHGGNSYHRIAVPERRFLRRAVRDMADACLAVADMPPEPALFGVDPDIVRLQLILAFLRLHLDSENLGHPKVSGIWQALPRLARLDIEMRAKIAYCLGLGTLPLCLWLAPSLRGWISVQDRRPRWADALLSNALGVAHQARRRAQHRPRLLPAQPDSVAADTGSAEAACYNRFDWRDLRSAGRRLLCRPSGEILVALPRMPYGARLGFDLAATSAYVDTPLVVALDLGDERLARTSFTGEGRISLILEPSETLGELPLRLRMSAWIQPTRLRDTAHALFGPSALLEVSEIFIEPLPPEATHMLLGLGEVRRFAEIVGSCLISPRRNRAVDPAGPIETRRLVLGLVRPTLAMPTELVLRFGATQVAGSLVASAQQETLYCGWIGPGAEARIALPPRGHREDWKLDLTLELDPSDPFDEPAFDLASLGMVGSNQDRLSPRADRSHPTPLLVPGGIHSFAAGASASFLGEGWVADESGALLFDMLGTLCLAVGPAASDESTLHLLLAPAGPLLADVTLAVAVSVGEVVLTQIRLRGEYELAVPLAAALRDGNRYIELSMHVALLLSEAEMNEPRRGALRLASLRLSSPATAAEPAPWPRPEPEKSLGADIRAVAARAKALGEIGSTTQANIDALLRARDRLISGMRGLAGTAVLSVLLTDETLDALLSLARSCDEADWRRPSPCEGDLFVGNAAEAGRAFALAILSKPGWSCLAGRPVVQCHEVLRAFPSAFAAYLCANSTPPRTAAELDTFRSHVLGLYAYARDTFLTEPRGSRHDRLAEQILFRLHPHPLLFAEGPLCDLGVTRGAAIEAYLIRRGNRITLARRPPPPQGRLRLGVLVRSLAAAPETWILNGTVGHLDTAVFEVILFVADGSEHASLPPAANMQVVNLDGVGVDGAVQTIRAAEIDILLLGAFFMGYDRLAAIAAHRLAPVQIATTAVSPMTTGLRSFDAMLSSHGCEPQNASSHYSERLHLAEMPVQRFDFGVKAADPLANHLLVRAQLGLPPEAVVLTSGAVVGKIGEPLLETWLDVLAAAPTAVLVLYPFARNWQTNFARRRFERRLDAGCSARSINPARVVLLDTIAHTKVEGLLAASDVYLDSFPYGGATTVYEALSCGLPAVALAGDTQRGLQGAAWLRVAGLGDLVATTPAAYSATAARLANSAEARAAARAAICLPAADDPAFARDLAGTILNIAGVVPQPSYRYLFHHMPKAGGTSCRRVFADWFAVQDDDRSPWDLKPPPPPLDLHSIGSKTLICGHFNSAGRLLRDRYPAVLADPHWRLITFLRDPLETALSYHAFECEHRPEFDSTFRPLDIDGYLETCPPHLAEHMQSIADDWRTALGRYWFVGTLDRMDEGLRWLADFFGQHPPEQIAHLNRSHTADRPSDAAISAFVRRNAEEFVIYRAATARAAAILATDPGSYPL